MLVYPTSLDEDDDDNYNDNYADDDSNDDDDNDDNDLYNMPNIAPVMARQCSPRAVRQTAGSSVRPALETDN